MADPFTIKCTHTLEAHVIYDRLASGYRALLRCQCHKLVRTSCKLRDTVAMAEADGAVMMAAPPRRRAPRYTGATALVATPSAVPPGLTANEAWVLYWRFLCAKHGHESRLSIPLADGGTMGVR